MMTYLGFSQGKRSPDRNKQMVNLLTMGICLLKNRSTLEDLSYHYKRCLF